MRLRRTRRIAVVIVTALLTGVLAPLAYAAVTSPTPNQTVAGVFPITEARGGVNGGNNSLLDVLPCSGAYSRLEIYRQVGSVSTDQIVNYRYDSPPGSGSDQLKPYTYDWNTVGLQNGTYRIKSITADTSQGLFACGSLQAEVVRSDFIVNVDNGVIARLDLPSTQYPGESLTIGVNTQVEATNAVLASREVTVEVVGIGSQTITTDAAGHGSVTFNVPDMPVGTLTVKSTTVGEPQYSLREATGTIELIHRPTKLVWSGNVRGNPGDTVTLAATLTDDTPGSARNGQPLGAYSVDLTLGTDTASAMTNTSGRASRTTTLSGSARTEPARAEYDGNDLYAGSSRDLTFLIGDTASLNSPTEHKLVGGIARLGGNILTKPSGAPKDVTSTLEALLPGLTPIKNLDKATPAHLSGLAPVDDILTAVVGPVASNVGELGDQVDAVLDPVLEGAEAIPGVGDVIKALPYEWQSVYIAPNGDHVKKTFGAKLLVPEPLDITGDGYADVLANLTLKYTEGADTLGLPFLPVLKFTKLPDAPTNLPLSLQAVLAGDSFVSAGGAEGSRLRFGFDTRSTSAPHDVEMNLGITDGGFNIEVISEQPHDLAVSGAFEGEGSPLGGIGGGAPDSPNFEDPIEPGPIGKNETRFALSFAPAPTSAKIGLGLGGSDGSIGVNFDTNKPSKVGLEFVQDTGGDEVTAFGGSFDTVQDHLALSVNAGSSGSATSPNLGLQLQSPGGLDNIGLQMRSYKGGQVASDLLLSLTDVPDTVNFGVTDDGGFAITSSGTIGLLEAGFASGSAIKTIDNPAYLYMSSDEDVQSVAIRLPQVVSMTAAVTGNLGISLDMAPTPLRALVESDGLSLDANIYDAPQQFSLGLSATGAFLIDGSAPIDLITITSSGEGGVIGGASNLNLRLETIPKRLEVGLTDEQIQIDTGGKAIGLLEISASSGAPPVLDPANDGVLLTQVGTDFALGMRMTGLRNFTVNLNPETFGMDIDTVANRKFVMDITLEDQVIHGLVDVLKPNMHFGVDELGGLVYSADEPTNSINFDIPGFATFSASGPLPTSLYIVTDPVTGVLKIQASDYTTLNLDAELGGVTAEITDFRVRLMEFGAVSPFGDGLATQNPPDTDGYQAMYMNTTEYNDTNCVDGCKYALGAAEPTYGVVKLGPIDFGGLEANITFTPRGLVAEKATVVMNIVVSGISATATHILTQGGMHCTGTSATDGTNLITTASIVTVQMRNALCGGSTALADLTTTGAVAPDAVVAGNPVTQSFTAKNTGPAQAAAVQIVGTYTDVLGDPTVNCPGATPVTGTINAGTATCVWTGNTAINISRTMNLTWPTTTDDIGDSLQVDYVASSTTSGADATDSATTEVASEVANLAITNLTASPEAVAGVTQAVHHIEAINNGPSDAQNFRIAATSNGALGAPSVVCSADGTVSGAGCVWDGVTASGASHSADITWNVPAGTASTTLKATHTVSSDTPGANPSQEATTNILGEKSGLAITGVDAPVWSAAGLDVTHVAHAVNNGPSVADTMRLNADHSGAFGDPDTACSNGGIANVFTELNRARCVWLGSTPAGAERTVSLTFGTPEDTPAGTPLKVSYKLTSNTTGADATASATTLIQDTPDTADLRIASTTAPSIWAVGAALVQRVDVANDGPGTALNAVIGANLPTNIAAPAVTCSTGGTPTTVGSRAECAFPAGIASGDTAWLSLSFASASMTGLTGQHVVTTYDTYAFAPGVHPTASTDTEILAAVANMTVTGGTGPATISTVEALTHSAAAQRSGPSGATNMKITGTYDLNLGEPTTATCSSGAAPTSTVPVVVGPGVRSCTYASTTGTTSRTLTLGWSAAQLGAAPVGTVHETVFTVTSDTPGSPATVTRNTTVVAPSANLTITGGTGPATITTAEALTHSVIANRSGTLASDIALTGTYPTTYGEPTTATCSTGATPTSTVPVIVGPGIRRCTYPSGTATTARTLTLGWSAAQVAAAGPGANFTTTYDVTSSTPGVAPQQIIRSTAVQAATATLTITGGSAPTQASTIDAISHSVIANRSGTLASDIVLTGTYPTTYGEPTTATCSSGATPSSTVPVIVGPGVRRCTYASGTATTARTLTLGWSAAQVAAAGPGANFTTTFDVTSSTAGVTPQQVVRSTNVVAASATMLITSMIAPANVTTAGNMVQRIDATNSGPQTANAFRIEATHDGSLGNPTVVCSSGGTITNSAGLARCQWAAATAANTARFMTLTWAVPAATVATFPVNYTVTSGDTYVVPATQSVSTNINT